MSVWCVTHNHAGMQVQHTCCSLTTAISHPPPSRRHIPLLQRQFAEAGQHYRVARDVRSTAPVARRPMATMPLEAAAVIAGCHSLVDVDGKTVGDPLEEASLKVRWGAAAEVAAAACSEGGGGWTCCGVCVCLCLACVLVLLLLILSAAVSLVLLVYRRNRNIADRLCTAAAGHQLEL